MKKNIKVFYLILFSALVISLLAFPQQALGYALMGLQLWFNKMIPTLLPFMILSSIMVQLEINTSFMTLFTPVLSPVFWLNKQCLYVIFIGFLCGFPMGAKTCAQLYSMGKITKEEGEYLLAFCNNIGPVYFVGFVLVSLQITNALPYLFGMYGIPILYGIFLRYTFYRNKLHYKNQRLQLTVSTGSHSPLPLLEVIDNAIMGSLRQIAMLGGYMVLFNILNLIPYLLRIKRSILVGFTNCFLEITGGILKISTTNQKSPLVAYLIFTSLAFGGLSCMAQTLSVLKETDLSSKKYILHKIILWFLSCLYYLFLFW